MPPNLTKGAQSKFKRCWARLNTSKQKRCYLSLVIIYMQKIKDIDAFLSEILMIKESCS